MSAEAAGGGALMATLPDPAALADQIDASSP
jgi:hypothetical protein